MRKRRDTNVEHNIIICTRYAYIYIYIYYYCDTELQYKIKLLYVAQVFEKSFHVVSQPPDNDVFTYIDAAHGLFYRAAQSIYT